MITIEEIQEFFFKAMLQGYVSPEVKKQPVDGMPHHKKIELIEADLRLTDIYWVTPYSDQSAGTTTIFWNNIPVWWMSYGGFYKAEAIPTLTRALEKAYTDKLFMGGRGPWQFNHEGLHYLNKAEGDFSKFSGREFITNSRAGTLGYHQYFGICTLPD